ncbi:MAG: hypothetical protein HY788_09560 [Deltaproteobacteria bacterium]|nr:hypothetical protein [Deltaproteobacteria bacterium]
MLRSVGRWGVLKSMGGTQIRLKGDERIPGVGDFVEKPMHHASAQIDRRYRLRENWIVR